MVTMVVMVMVMAIEGALRGARQNFIVEELMEWININCFVRNGG